MSTLKSEYRVRQSQVIQVRQGDITQEDTDAIVNAANSQLRHGGGVAGAIVRQGGYVIQEESDGYIRMHGPVPTGQVAVTGAGKLPCKTIIHAVGPVWHGGDQHEEEHLRSAVWNSLVAAEELRLKSIALPAISSGIFGFPKERCAHILIKTGLTFFYDHPESSLREIRFTNIDDQTTGVFENVIIEFLRFNQPSIIEFFDNFNDAKYLYDTLIVKLMDIGNIDVKVTKSQIAVSRVKAFAWVWIPGKYLRGKTAPLVLTIALPYRDPSPRWKEVVEPAAGHFTHHLELFTNADIDSEVSDWLRTAWEQAG